MLPSTNSSFMNQGLPSNPNTSNPVGVGYAAGYSAPQVGGYNGSQGTRAYGHMGTYGGPPVYGTPTPSSGGFSEAAQNAHLSYQNQPQHRQSAPTANRVPGGGIYPNTGQPFHPV